MVLTFALCASFAFAQTNATAVKKTTDNAVRVVPTAEELSASIYTGSIFTKDDDPIFSCDFSNGAPYTTGTITTEGQTSQKVLSNGQVVTLDLPRHTNNYQYASWYRWADTTAQTVASMESQYPCVVSRFGTWFANFKSTTPDNGFMLMSMIDNYVPWGGFSDASGGQDAYIQFQAFQTTGHPLVVARFYQMYRKFNSDKTYFDYQVNGQWYSMEFNVKGIDMATNTNYVGWKRVTLPVEVGNVAAATIRIRWVDESDDQNGGYFYAIDDLTIIDAPDYQLTLKTMKYFEGFYHMMPQGLQVPVVWATEFVNDGKFTQTNITGSVYSYAAGDASAAVVASNTVPTVVTNPIIVRAAVIDPLGWYDSAAVGRDADNLWVGSHGTSYWDYATHTAASTKGYLPTENLGTRYFYSDMTSPLWRPVHIYGDTATFDTMRYDVNWNATAEHPHGVWARDHGVIRDSSSYTYGLITSSTFSEEGVNWNKENYGVLVGYVTGDTVPEGWKILGVEIVPATRPDRCGIYQGQAARIRPVLKYTYLNEDGSGMYTPTFDLGTSAHEIQANETYTPSFLSTLTFAQNGQYPTIKIWFNNQPDLEPGVPYYVGYELAEEGPFAAATCGNWFSRGSGANWEQVWFGDQEGMEDYGNVLYADNNYYTVKVMEPMDGRNHSFSASVYPMIRMLVGPGFDVPRTTIELQCQEDGAYGYFTRDGETPLCGEIDSVPIGGSKSYYVFPVNGYKIDKIYVDGVALTSDQYELDHDSDNDVDYAYFILDDIPAAGHVLNCTFKENIGFDPVAANVAMKLQPNPASSNVQVSLKGVSGNVNMSVIDMSGRVVATTQFNAENGTSINVSNLAKGAYFVRITNDKFSKVEKLIVR